MATEIISIFTRDTSRSVSAGVWTSSILSAAAAWTEESSRCQNPTWVDVPGMCHPYVGVSGIPSADPSWEHNLAVVSATPLEVICLDTDLGTSETTTLSVSGGTSPFTWYLTSGLGSVSAHSSTVSADYTSPATGSDGSANVSVLDYYSQYDAETIDYILLPYTNQLWAWYKCDEGEGTVLTNSATAMRAPFAAGEFPNLPVVAGSDYWSTVPNGGTGWCIRDLGSTFVASAGASISPLSGAVPLGCFVYLTGAWPFIYTLRGYCQFTKWTEYLYSAAVNFGLYPFPNQASSTIYGGVHGAFTGLNPQAKYQDRWFFQFMTATPDPAPGVWGKIQAHFIWDDGTKSQGAEFNVGESFFSWDPGVGMIGRYWSQAWGHMKWVGYIGDIIMYQPTTSMTLAEWAVWYDSRRTRYNMAERSGW